MPKQEYMITSINKIHAIGRYEAFNDGVSIGKNQVIFGFNGSGKSTLSDIFYSLSSTERFGSLVDRRTLCKEDGTEPLPQFIEMESDNGTYQYENGSWNSSENVMVFNDHFIDEYVLINDNYKSDSAAIHFGKEETALASEIKKIDIDNQTLWESINMIIASNRSLCGDLKLGKTIVTSANYEKRLSKIAELQLYPVGAKEAKEKALANQREADIRVRKISNWKEYLDAFTLIHDLEKEKKLVGLQKLLKEEPRITADEIKEHVERYMKQCDINWLLAGRTLQKELNICPYCGQELNASDYKRFSEKLERFISSRQKQKADTITKTVSSIVPLFDVNMLEKTFSNLLRILEENAEDRLLLKATTDRIKKIVALGGGEPEEYAVLLKKIRMKEQNPYRTIELSDKEQIALRSVIRVYKNISIIKSLLEQEQVRIEKKVKRDSAYKYEEALFIVSYGDNRSVFENLISNAKKYLNNLKKKDELQMRIDTLVDGRRVSEVNSFLDEMNVNYRIEIDGKRSLVRINGFESTEFRLREDKKLCSEGERRILAFAYFLQMINNTSGNKIIVVDDPISSLDLSRKSLVALKIVELMERAENQVIVLSHDIAFVEKIDAAGKALQPTLQFWELTKGDNPFSLLDINDYLQSDEHVYEAIIHDGEISSDENDRIVAYMAMRPYSDLKSLEVQGGENQYKEIERRSTYFAHSRYSRNRYVKYSKRLYSTASLRRYCYLVNKLTGKAFDKMSLVPDAYRFTGFDYNKAWEIYNAISMDTVMGLRKKALVFRVVLESTLFMLIDKNCMDPERIGLEYQKAAKQAKIRTKNRTLAEKRQWILKLCKLYTFAKKYLHGAEGRSTMGLSALNPEEMRQFDRDITEIHEWILNHTASINSHARSFSL